MPESESTIQNAQNTPAKPQLLAIPQELRDQIYCELFQELITTVDHAYDPHPTPAQFQDYVAVSLSCQQLHEELGEYFKNELSRRLTFFAESAEQLLAVVRRFGNTTQLRHARFCLRIGVSIDEFGKNLVGNCWNDRSLGPINAQPEVAPMNFFKLFIRPPEDLMRIYNGTMITSCRKSCVCGRNAGNFCFDFQQLVWPTFASGCTLSRCIWQTSPSNCCAPGMVGSRAGAYWNNVECALLEGPLSSLSEESFTEPPPEVRPPSRAFARGSHAFGQHGGP